jgi:hypothetical protein
MLMTKFILFFTEKEGSSPIVRLLENFEGFAVVHQTGGGGYEPFDSHNCGPMSNKSLRACLEIVFGDSPIDFAELNRIYMRTAVRPLQSFDDAHVGLKMRFVPPRQLPRLFKRAPLVGNQIRRGYVKYQVDRGPFRRMMLEVLQKRGVTVLMAVRQDVFRWALSKYHGDGTGRRGHLQFALASGKLRREDIPRIHVDCERFESVVRECELAHERKRRLVRDLEVRGIAVYPLVYEDFVGNPQQFFASLLRALGTERPRSEIEAALERGTGLKRVHVGDVCEYVVNHREVVQRFGGRFVAWERGSHAKV